MLPSKCTLVSTILFILIVICDQIAGKFKCGTIMSPVRGGKLQGKIVGGYDIGFYKYPWFAALQINDDTQCGGALIGHKYVLTAAHCFDYFINHHKKLEDAYLIKLGIYDNCKKEPTQKVFKTTKVYIHERYAKKKPYYDIALLELSPDATGYEPICLPPKKLGDADQEAEGWIIGLGSMVEGGGDDAYPCQMHEARLLMYDSQTCKKMLHNLSDVVSETAFIKALCAGYKAGGIDTCQGDSGGPLMTLNSLTSKWQTVGITSFGYGCGMKDAMGIYTDVSQYLDWIEEKSGISAAKEYEEDLPAGELSDATNFLANTFTTIYDHIMNSAHPPTEIVIRFKSKKAPNVTSSHISSYKKRHKRS